MATIVRPRKLSRWRIGEAVSLHRGVAACGGEAARGDIAGLLTRRGPAGVYCLSRAPGRVKGAGPPQGKQGHFSAVGDRASLRPGLLHRRQAPHMHTRVKGCWFLSMVSRIQLNQSGSPVPWKTFHPSLPSFDSPPHPLRSDLRPIACIFFPSCCTV